MRVKNKFETSVSIYEQIKSLKSFFGEVMIVDPLTNTQLSVEGYSTSSNRVKCTKNCPMAKDKTGCICKDIIATKEERSRFLCTSYEAYFIIGKVVRIKYNEYVLVVIKSLDPKFSFGALPATEVIDNVTKVSSNLVRDPLTHIFNRKYLMDNIQFMMDKAYSENKPLCLACIDIDNFKRFNDTYGHDFGDKVLITVAKRMKESIEELNEAYPIRIGGDEFIIVGVDIHKARFKMVMTKLCDMIEATKLLYNNKEKVGIKISIGVSEMLEDRLTEYKGLYDKADHQLYVAKEAGKGCVR